MEYFPLPSEFKSRKEWEDRAWKKLAEELAKTSVAEDVERILPAIVSAHEKRQIVKRAAATCAFGAGKKLS